MVSDCMHSFMETTHYLFKHWHEGFASKSCTIMNYFREEVFIIFVFLSSDYPATFWHTSKSWVERVKAKDLDIFHEDIFTYFKIFHVILVEFGEP